MYGDHRDLHSFPTRRSSDLRLGRTAVVQLSPAARCTRARGLGPDRKARRGRRRSRRRHTGGLVVDRKSTRLNSSHANISYAVFCLKKNTPTYTSSFPASHLL